MRCQSTEMSLLNERHIALKEEYAKTQMCIVKEILTVAGEFLGDRWHRHTLSTTLGVGLFLWRMRRSTYSHVAHRSRQS